MRRHRSTVVISLLAVAVLVPSGAWWVSGSTEARRRARTILNEAADRTVGDLNAATVRLEGQLEVLRLSEARRPFYHYQNLTHEPRGASEGLSIIPSPLAAGAPDLLVGAHFQIAPDGQVSLPTVNEEFPEFSTGEGYAMYCDLLSDMSETLVVEPVVGGEAGSLQRVPAGQEDRLLDSDQGHVVILDLSQWRQIEQANQVYAELSGRGSELSTALVSPRPGGLRPAKEIEIPVGPLRWNTLVVGGTAVLAALRQVETPRGVLVQGFTVDPDAAVERAGGLASLRLVDGASEAAEAFAAAVGHTGWLLESDASALLDQASEEAQGVIDGFQRRFAFSFVGALAAACCVALIVIQTDRLARQRMRFAAMAAHELKTPLSSLRLYSEMLAEGLGDPDRSAAYADKIATEAGRLGRVVVNILDLSRLERGAALVNLSAGDLAECVSRCVDGLRSSLEAAGLIVELQVSQSVPSCRFDGDAICQILTNLLDNAERYTRDVDDRRVVVEVAQRGPEAVVTVADTGRGVPEAARRTLFKAFIRGVPDGSSSGLGLGLALGRSLARAQGGDLELLGSSSMGGADFALRLPVS